jgi:hypothetical protein
LIDLCESSENYNGEYTGGWGAVAEYGWKLTVFGKRIGFAVGLAWCKTLRVHLVRNEL